MRARIAILIALTWVLAAVQGLPLVAAQAQDKYKVEVTQVEAGQFPRITLYVSVTDEAGKPVTSLAKEDFTIVEEGKTVTITDFAGLGSNRPVDVVFVFDTTGSMGDEVDGVKERCIAFAEELENKHRDYRLGLVTFWDEVKGVYGTGGKLTDDVDEFKGWISTIRPVGGEGAGDEENDFGALKEAATGMQFRAEAQRVFILITDNLPHHYGDPPDDGVPFDDPDLTVDRTIDILGEPPVTVYAIAYGDAEFRRIADETGGRFYDIAAETDFTDIIDEIGGLIATQYQMSYDSARPTYDGTRRGITVQVGEGVGGSGGAGTSEYMEEHMVNFQSNLLVGLAFLVPLLVALAVPVLQPARAGGTGGAAASRLFSSTADGDVVLSAGCHTSPHPAVASRCGEAIVAAGWHT
jgi:VWFA-related protein